MKLNNPVGSAAGSFSSPEKIASQIREQQDVTKKAAAGKQATDEVVKNMEAATEEWPMNEEAALPTEEPTTKEPSASQKFFEKKPLDMLREIGIEPTEDDFHSLIFRGSIRKTVPVVKNPVTGNLMTVELKTLTGEEVDMVDELLVEEVETTKMTNEGMEARRAAWLMSVAIIKLADKTLVKKEPLDEGGRPDVKELARMKRRILLKLNPFILNRIIGLHSTMVTAFNSILINDSEGELLKK